MATPLLTTRLLIPPLRARLVARPRLAHRLEEGLRSGCRLTLISAPPGSGKTTLLGEWASSSPRPVAWLSLDESDNDPVQFVRYLVAALQQVDRCIGQTVLEAVGATLAPSVRELLTLLINDLAEGARDLTLVLDDYHLVGTASVHEALRFLVDHQPPHLHVVIGTRQDPPLPLEQLRARGQVTEIRDRDLRFTAAETAAFLDRTMGLHLAGEAVAALDARTEGWIAGLQLAALTLQEAEADAETFIATFAGDDRYVTDYLVAEVVRRQPDPVRRFLHQTAILDRLTASLCDAVTGQADGQALLEQLDRANLFLIPLDHRREWYRYHRLFAEALRARLDQEERRRLHQRAAGWYKTNGLPALAIQHALASGDLDGAERLIRQAAESTLHQGGIATVIGWLKALPEAHVRADGKLATWAGWALAMNGEMGEANAYAQAAEECLRRAKAPAAEWGELQLLRGVLALGRRDYVETTACATAALSALEETALRWRIIALWVLAEAQERTRPISEAVHSLRQARHVGRAAGHQIFAAVIEAGLAAALNHRGLRREAVAVCEEAIVRYIDSAGRVSPGVALVLGRLAALCYEANELEVARGHVERGMALSRHLPPHGPQMVCLGVSASILHARGDSAAALEALRQARQLAIQQTLGDATWLEATEVTIRLQQGDLAFAVRWADAGALSLDDTPHYLRIEQHAAYARLLIAQERTEDARRWLVRLERFAEERELSRWLITLRILLALAAQQSGDLPTARGYLARTLEMAAPEGYVRAFLDEDSQVVGLLPAVRRAAPALVARLLRSAGVIPVRQGPGPEPLIEPLSEREREVLGLIAAGLSNGEIADRLVITTGTVKRHIHHIFGKLGVSSRTQAIVRASALRLLPSKR
ncbi:MAG: AAA family ATPase [Chloroflexi bacterium]|nr:AAA family ATPase [Chloroflexota bacterium]